MRPEVLLGVQTEWPEGRDLLHHRHRELGLHSWEDTRYLRDCSRTGWLESQDFPHRGHRELLHSWGYAGYPQSGLQWLKCWVEDSRRRLQLWRGCRKCLQGRLQW
ncbi:hypothetical protein BU26DRAFT_334139 [Trematosphaeria pertusa]|uniref:Uncharacterized protein n=1 Tax=Trematosphaeria pertusa TaxID=390896 RepID=A0A6A6IFY5_9PLEO|nr:uncharacterized protein BU26DRAFT_334139 [Trematosphaeria pertusa]KAF2248440.1 hypothetical protein BU26DRAFT_334139 [Trematosphaeria pertusa]